jgi:hypothetical protein
MSEDRFGCDFYCDQEDAGDIRLCINCGDNYNSHQHKMGQYWDPPYSYSSGSETFCLSCWLGCGPEVPIYRSDASEGCSISAVVDLVFRNDRGEVCVLLHAPFHVLVEEFSKSWGYQLNDEERLLDKWERFESDDIRDTAFAPTYFGRGVLVLNPNSESQIRNGQKLEFVLRTDLGERPLQIPPNDPKRDDSEDAPF